MATKKAGIDKGKQKKSPKVVKGKIGTPKKIVGKKTAPLIPKGGGGNQLIIQGKITDQNSAPRSGLTVKAFDRNVGTEDTLLGQTTTDVQGNYSITYMIKKLGGKSAADLVICMYQDGKLLQTSDVIFNARQKVTKDFIIPVAGKPELRSPDENALKLEARFNTLKVALPDTGHQKILKNELQTAKGDLAAALKVLKNKLPSAAVQRLQSADLVATAIGDKPEVVKSILSQTDIKTTRDMANLNVDKLTALIAPDAQPQTDAYQQAKSQAIAINNQSFAREPLTVLQRMTHEGELPIADGNVRAGLGSFLQRIPADTNIRLTPIRKVLTVDALKDVPEEQRAAVVDNAKALWRTMAITPLDAPQALTILMKTNRTSAFLVGEMPESTFLKAYGGPMGKETAQRVYTNAINTRIRNEHALITMREAIRGTGLAAMDGTKTREKRLADAKQYAEANDIQLNLDNLFGDMDYCECKECQSIYSASSYFVELLNFLRNNNLGPDPATGGANANIRTDLKDISGTPLESLFRRRPDLGDLELTCENTNTVLPYIDLVNEVMESFVVHRVGYGESEPKLDVYNITDETKDELLAQPQHTSYEAYCILKNEAVYPFNLPFHQPIEAARIYLKYLGTSRYEVLDSFRAARESLLKLTTDPNPFSDTCARDQQAGRVIEPDQQQQTRKLLPDGVTGKNLHNEVLDRATDAEFLGLTQEEYIILTKEAFWPKKYFDITQKTTFPDEQYRQTIGVKQVYEYYGYATREALLDPNEDSITGQTGLHFVKKQFLPRTGIQYTDLVEMLKTRYINPRYPKGLALAILENIQSSYSFLQTLVDTSSTDAKMRFAKLIAFLESEQSWTSVPQVVEASGKMPSPVAASTTENPIIRQWVYCCFEKLGQLIVLESGEGPQLPIEGKLYVDKEGVDSPCAVLRSDGMIVGTSNDILVGTVSVEIVKDRDGNPRAYAGPVNWTNPSSWETDTYNITDAHDNVIGRIDSQGLWRYCNRKEWWIWIQVEWIAPKDTCNLDKVRLVHLDGSPVAGEGPQLPIEGKLYAASNGSFVGILSKDGIIVDGDGTVIAHVTLSGDVVDNNGNIFANNFPPNNLLNIIDDKGARVGWVSAVGLLGPHEQHLGWLPPNLDEYDRMQRFIRLWRKLGWTIDEVDKALEGLATKTVELELTARKIITPPVAIRELNNTSSPSEDWTPCCGNETGNGDITPDFLHQLVAVRKLLDSTGLPLIKLLSLWADISTVGDKSLYASLFLTHNMLGIDNVFQADDNGNYLTGSEKITDHLPVLMAALKLKADQISSIQTIRALTDDLTLANVSTLYRFGLLAKILGVKAADLGDLVSLFGYPFQSAVQTFELIETWGKMEDAGFTFRQLTYIIKDLDDAQKPLTPSQKTQLQIAKTIYDGLNTIESDNQDVIDAEQATADLVRAKAGQVFEAPVVEKIVGLLEGTMVYTTNAPSGLTIAIPDPQPTWAAKFKYIVPKVDPTIDPKDAPGPSIQVTGILTDDLPNGEQAQVIKLFPELSDALDRVRKQALAFFNDAFVGLFTDESKDENTNNQAIKDAQTNLLAGDVIVPADQITSGSQDPNTAPKKRLYFLQHFLPLLRQRLERRFIRDTMSAAFGLPGDVTNVLLSNVVVTTESKPRSAMSVLETIRASQPQAGKGWTGYLIPPTDDNYAFVAYAPDPNDPNTAPSPLTIQGFKDPVKFKNQQADPTNVWSTDPVPLKAGMLYLLTIADGDVSELKWRTTTLPATQIPTSALLPNDTTAGTEDVFKKFSKAAIVVNGFNLSADEVRYFKDHGADFSHLDFNAITLDCWKRLAAYTTLRASLPKAGMPLLDLFAWACQPDDHAKLFEKLAAVTQWDVTRIKALIAGKHFNLNRRSHFKNEVNLVKMQKAIAVADKVGVDIDRLFYWAVPGSKFWPCHTITEDIRMAMRARFDEEDWEQAVKPLSDQLREMQKQALIAFLLNQPDLRAWPVVDADSLFEFFLIDVQMGTERQTSRMVQAIASVQLFINRCLMGLEEKLDENGNPITDANGNPIGVSSAAIDRERWEWMQKYRVWEANRKVFLYPENWILPELRDDKSPFYKELESELLQKDINSQTIEEALKSYLYKVDEVANLKVVGLFIEPATDQAGNELKDAYSKLHVFARTRNAPYFFYYRYFDIGKSNWYPWEKMQVDIPSYDVEDKDANGNNTGKTIQNGSFLIPVVWNNRLLIFYPQFMKKTVPVSTDKPLQSMGNSTPNSIKPTELWEIKMAWSEYRKGKWTQKQVSTDAIYCTIIPNNLVSSYVFLPTIITGSFPKVGIDIYHKVGSFTPPAPQPILLQNAELATSSDSSDITGINVTVISLVDNSLIASMKYPELKLSIQTPTPTKDQCKSFRVDISVSTDWKEVEVYIFKSFTVTLTFKDQDVIKAKKEAIAFQPMPNATGVQYMPLVNSFVYLPPDGPAIDSASLIIDTTGDGKNSPTTFDVSVCDQNDEEFAGVTRFGSGEGYSKGDHTIVPLNIVKTLKEAECPGFTVKITMSPHNDVIDIGHDTWEFNATVNLSFGTSTLTASQAIRLSVEGTDPNKNVPSVSFESIDPYVPPTATVTPPPTTVADVAIAQRFEFSGNKISVVGFDLADDLVKKLDSQNYHFHYKDLEDRKRIHSLQTEDDKAPLLLDSEPFFDDFDDNDTQLAIAQQQPCTFSYLSISKLLSTLNMDQIGNLYKYYLSLYDFSDPLKTDLNDAYGAYINDKGQPSYHELLQPYSLYNWEVGFHAPMQLVDHMLTSQQFDQAIAMCHYVFNPLAKPGDGEDILQRCWQFPPFKEVDATNVLQTLFESLNPGQPDWHINDWRDNPFQPHLIARGRPSAYMKYVVMKYIEILIAYGDYYFRQYTNESIPLAIQCYVMASHLYGPRGQKIPRRGKIENATYNSLLDKWDAFGNAMVEMELAFPFSNQTYVNISSADVGLANVFGSITTLYFSIPDNPNLTALRDTIDDRLLKIRSCENIEGIFQQPPLFEPPIDPALLVQAAAQGLSLSSVLNDMDSPMPNYRFYYLLQKALELCGELKVLGNAFLSAKEKGDAEALSNMRAKHESGIQNLVMEVKKQQLDEAENSLDALQQSRLGPESRMKYYLSLIGEDLSKVPDDSTDFSDLPNQLEQPVDESGLKLIRYEKEEMDKASDAAELHIGIGVVDTLASVFHALPSWGVKAHPWGVGTSVEWGMPNIAYALQATGSVMRIIADHLSYQSTSASRKSGFLRQLQDRVQQANSAGYEIKNIDKQILTQQIRIAIANQEITNQQQQIDNAQEVEDFLRNKYTNEELYSWMEGNIRTLYYQVYTLAYDLAKKVEKTYRFERGLSESNFIQFGYWDAGRDGLLAGERLYLALKQLETAYQEKRGYDYEITKHVSLRQLDPLALIQLRETGTCDFVLPEVLFDMDYPGHYMRRIKSVALTVPCIVGPYTSLNCTLRLTEHSFRTSSIVSPGYAETKDETDERFSTVNVPITSIAVSNGQNDSGVFELSFKDERYIPFEGAGAISKWRIELPTDFKQFDYDTISDVILHVRYTTVDGGDKLKVPASDSVQQFISDTAHVSQEEGLFAIFDLKNDFPTEWNKANHPPTDATERVMALGNLYERLPLFTKPWQSSPTNIEKIQPTDVWLFTSAKGVEFAVNGASFGAGVSEGDTMKLHLSDVGVPSDLVNWTLTIRDVATEVKKLWLVVRYTLKKIGS